MKGFTQSDVDEYNARRAAKRAAKRGLIVDPFAALAKFDAVADPDAVADGEAVPRRAYRLEMECSCAPQEIASTANSSNRCD